MKTHTVTADIVEEGLAPLLDSADVTDADVFEVLLQGNGVSTAASLSDQPAINKSLVISEGPVEQEQVSEIIDRFPFGSPGAPIPGIPQGRLTYELHQATIGDPVWAPFQSQCDSQFTHWAKMCRPTSSAVTDLLAIPEVCTPFYLHLALLSHVQRL